MTDDKGFYAALAAFLAGTGLGLCGGISFAGSIEEKKKREKQQKEQKDVYHR